MSDSTTTSENANENVRVGQKVILYAVLINLVAIVLGFLNVKGVITSALFLTAIGLALYGMFRMTSGLGYATITKVIFCILLLLPLISLITLIVLNGKATAHLRKNGYEVKFMGADKKVA
ncbi:MAG: hypothetical protein AAGB46_07735 [Verrucomicrobiota bacterium]